MSGRRSERLQVQRRNLLARALEQAELEGLEALAPEALARSEGLPLRSLGPEPEDLFFPDEDDLRAAFAAVLDHAGLLEATMAWARHLQEEGDLWRRRRALTEREPRLRLRRLVVPANQVVHPSRSGKLKAPTNSFQRNSDEPPQSSKILPLQSSPICEAGPGGDERGGGGAAGRVQRTDRPQVASAVQA